MYLIENIGVGTMLQQRLDNNRAHGLCRHNQISFLFRRKFLIELEPGVVQVEKRLQQLSIAVLDRVADGIEPLPVLLAGIGADHHQLLGGFEVVDDAGLVEEGVSLLETKRKSKSPTLLMILLTGSLH